MIDWDVIFFCLAGVRRLFMVGEAEMELNQCPCSLFLDLAIVST